MLRLTKGRVRGLAFALASLLVIQANMALSQVGGDRARPGADPWAGDAPPSTDDPSSVMRSGDARGSVRHRTFKQEGVPLEYRGLTSPFPASRLVTNEGNGLYQSHCAECHGPRGFGDGAAGSNLFPSPALLSQMVEDPGAVDGYLLWTIADGGVPIGTDMPAFKDVLSEDDIWKIIAFMRAGFPDKN